MTKGGMGIVWTGKNSLQKKKKERKKVRKKKNMNKINIFQIFKR